jgi:hypothetical protein
VHGRGGVETRTHRGGEGVVGGGGAGEAEELDAPQPARARRRAAGEEGTAAVAGPSPSSPQSRPTEGAGKDTFTCGAVGLLTSAADAMDTKAPWTQRQRKRGHGGGGDGCEWDFLLSVGDGVL